MMLKADIQIRALSGGNQSLDHTLSALQDCCLGQQRTWTARELLTRMDQLNGNDVFMSLYEEHVHDEAFPDVSEVYEQLGLVMGSENVTMNEAASGSDIRFLIMNPNPVAKTVESLPHTSGGQ